MSKSREVIPLEVRKPEDYQPGGKFAKYRNYYLQGLEREDWEWNVKIERHPDSQPTLQNIEENILYFYLNQNGDIKYLYKEKRKQDSSTGEEGEVSKEQNQKEGMITQKELSLIEKKSVEKQPYLSSKLYSYAVLKKILLEHLDEEFNVQNKIRLLNSFVATSNNETPYILRTVLILDAERDPLNVKNYCTYLPRSHFFSEEAYREAVYALTLGWMERGRNFFLYTIMESCPNVMDEVMRLIVRNLLNNGYSVESGLKGVNPEQFISYSSPPKLGLQELCCYPPEKVDSELKRLMNILLGKKEEKDSTVYDYPSTPGTFRHVKEPVTRVSMEFIRNKDAFTILPWDSAYTIFKKLEIHSLQDKRIAVLGVYDDGKFNIPTKDTVDALFYENKSRAICFYPIIKNKKNINAAVAFVQGVVSSKRTVVVATLPEDLKRCHEYPFDLMIEGLQRAGYTFYKDIEGKLVGHPPKQLPHKPVSINVQAQPGFWEKLIKGVDSKPRVENPFESVNREIKLKQETPRLFNHSDKNKTHKSKRRLDEKEKQEIYEGLQFKKRKML